MSRKKLACIADDEIAALRLLIERTTKGPWRSLVEGRDFTSGSSFIQTADGDIYLTGGTTADQDFIASARNKIPKLLQEIERLATRLEDLELNAISSARAHAKVVKIPIDDL